MSALRVGMRVKKVRGDANNGLTGVVVSMDAEFMTVRLEQPGTFYPAWGGSFPVSAGALGTTDPSLWEPIAPTPTCQEILDREALPEWSCPLPETVPARKEAA